MYTPMGIRERAIKASRIARERGANGRFSIRSGNNQFNSGWTDSELKLMASTYPMLFAEEEERVFPGRSHKALQEKAKILRIQRTGRRVLFPRVFNSDADGGYVTGLTDGEGSFMASIRTRDGEPINFNPKFGINLRADDRAILEWIARYFDCGTINVNRHLDNAPLASFWVAGTYDLMRSVVPHFTSYPLRAKKKRDFEIWLRMLNVTALHYRQYWSPSVRSEMAELYAELRGIRRYKAELAA